MHQSHCREDAADATFPEISQPEAALLDFCANDLRDQKS
jgi:hypothetical protein